MSFYFYYYEDQFKGNYKPTAEVAQPEQKQTEAPARILDHILPAGIQTNDKIIMRCLDIFERILIEKTTAS